MTDSVKLQIELNENISLAAQQNHSPVINKLIIANKTAVKLSDITIKITANPQFAAPAVIHLSSLDAMERYCLTAENIPLVLDALYLFGITEALVGSLSIDVFAANGGYFQGPGRTELKLLQSSGQF